LELSVDSIIGEQEKDLFIRIFRQLSRYRDPYQSISGILQEACEFFGFYSGFVYEADHAWIFHLCEKYLRNDADSQLKEQFLLSDYLDPQDIEELVKKTGEIVYLDSKKSKIGTKFLEVFSAKTLVMIPVLFNDAAPAAFVGIMDRRRPGRLSKREIGDADAILSVLAGHIKTRVYQKRLEYAHETMKNIVDKTGIDIYVVDFYTYEILFVNEPMAAAYGGSDKLMGKSCWRTLFPESAEPCDFCPRRRLIDEQGNPSRIYTWNFHHPRNGRWFRVISAAFRWVDGRLAHVVSSIDITENKHNELLIRQMAECDSLTSLRNRGKFRADMKESLEKMKQTGASGYLFFLDLDDFKAINDTRGHLAGDALLCKISDFLRSEESRLGRSYRYGGDEFAILAEYKTGDDLELIKDLLMRRFNKPWDLRGLPVYCQASIGAVKYPQEDASDEDLIHAADMAMYEVKKRGKHDFQLTAQA
jgi:diguanylate cyclase (GGDEF)-like protein